MRNLHTFNNSSYNSRAESKKSSPGKEKRTMTFASPRENGNISRNVQRQPASRQHSKGSLGKAAKIVSNTLIGSPNPLVKKSQVTQAWNSHNKKQSDFTKTQKENRDIYNIPLSQPKSFEGETGGSGNHGFGSVTNSGKKTSEQKSSFKLHPVNFHDISNDLMNNTLDLSKVFRGLDQTPINGGS